MSDTRTTDPNGGFESPGLQGTDTSEDVAELTTATGSGGKTTIGRSEILSWTPPEFESTGSEDFVDETAEMRYRLKQVEDDTAQLQRVHKQMRRAQESTGVDSIQSLLTNIGTIQTNVAELEARIEDISETRAEDSQQSAEQSKPERKAMETSSSVETYIKLAQFAFVALGGLSIYLSTTLQSGPWPIVATFAVPVFFTLAFGGVIAERSQLQVTHGNNVS